MSGRVRRVAGPAVAAATLTALVLLAVHPSGWVTRLGTLPLAAALWTAFAVGAWLVRRAPARYAVVLIILGGIGVQLAALSAPPRGSDDLYRYIWDGRVQAAGIDAYRYVPGSGQLAPLRDPFLWPARAPYCITPGTRAMGHGEVLTPGCTRINRPTVPTIYPPVAQAYFLTVQEVSPAGSGSTPIQAAAALWAVATTLALLYGLRMLGRDVRLAVLWAWCPAVALAAGNNAHVDVVAAALAAVALVTLARAGRLRRTLAGGALLGLAIAAKLTPVLVMPAVLRRRWYAVLSAAAAATGIVYLPHLLAVGGAVIGFVPGYLHQQGYDNGSRFALIGLVTPGRWAIAVAFAILAAVALAVARRSDPDRPWRGALVMTGAALLVATPPFPWYALLLVMLVALDGRAEWLALAAAKYFSTRHPLPFAALSGTSSEQLGYGLALTVIVAVSLARWHRSRKLATGPPAPSRPAPRWPLPAGLWTGLVSDPGALLPPSPAAAAPTHAASAARR